MADDKPPRLAFELLQELAKEVPAPKWPTTMVAATKLTDDQVRQNIWYAAQRSLIEALLELYEVENSEEETDEDDPSYWTGENAPRIIPASLDVHTASVGHPEGLDARTSGPVLDVGD